MNESRQYPCRPFLGVGALIFQDDEILLVQRGKPPLVDWWSLPGGIVEAGERLEEAIKREVFEETGLDVSADSIATVFERIMPDPEGACEYHYVLIDFYCTVQGGSLRPGDDSKQVAWRDFRSLQDIQLTAGTREVIEACCTKPSTHPYVTRP